MGANPTLSARIERGRSGSDEGIDIRAFERVGPLPVEDERQDEREDEQPEEGETESQNRLSVIQCKREKSISPAKVRTREMAARGT